MRPLLTHAISLTSRQSHSKMVLEATPERDVDLVILQRTLIECVIREEKNEVDHNRRAENRKVPLGGRMTYT